MPRYHQDAEAREAKLQQLIRARIEATRQEVKLGRVSTVRAVDDVLSLDSNLIATLISTTVIEGPRAAACFLEVMVDKAIERYAEELAEKDADEMERARTESRDENRIAMAECDRLMV